MKKFTEINCLPFCLIFERRFALDVADADFIVCVVAAAVVVVVEVVLVVAIVPLTDFVVIMVVERLC